LDICCCCCWSSKTSLCIDNRCEHTRTVINNDQTKHFIQNKSFYLSEKKTKKKKKKKSFYQGEKKHQHLPPLVQRCLLATYAKKREKIFFSSFFFLPFYALADLSKGLVRLSFLFFSSSFLSPFLFVLELDTLVNGGSYRLHTYTNDNLRHLALLYRGKPDLHPIAKWLDERNDVGEKKDLTTQKNLLTKKL